MTAATLPRRGSERSPGYSRAGELSSASRGRRGRGAIRSQKITTAAAAPTTTTTTGMRSATSVSVNLVAAAVANHKTITAAVAMSVERRTGSAGREAAALFRARDTRRYDVFASGRTAARSNALFSAASRCLFPRARGVHRGRAGVSRRQRRGARYTTDRE